MVTPSEISNVLKRIRTAKGGGRTEDALIRLYFHLLISKNQKDYPYGMYSVNVLPPVDEDGYKEKLEKWMKWKEFKKTAGKRGKMGKPEKVNKPHTRSVQQYQNLLQRFVSTPFIKDLRLEDGKHYYQANPVVIHAFLRKYSMSEDEFSKWKQKEEEMREVFKKYGDNYEEIVRNMRKRVKEIPKEKAYLGYEQTEDEEYALATRRLMTQIEKKGYFESMLWFYLQQIPRIDETEIDIPKQIDSFARLRRKREQRITEEGIRKSKFSDVEWIVANHYWHRETKSMVRPSLFLTWWNFDNYRKEEKLSEKKEGQIKKEDQILRWALTHIMWWMVAERKKRKVNIKEIIDIDWIDGVEDHFLTDFPKWKEKLEEFTIGKGYKKIRLIKSS